MTHSLGYTYANRTLFGCFCQPMIDKYDDDDDDEWIRYEWARGWVSWSMNEWMKKRFDLSTRACNSPDAQPVDRKAVHCLQIDFQVGSGLAQKFTGVSLVEHENYVPTGDDWDIAVIRLPTRLRYDNNTRPVCLPSTPADAGTKCVATGWGSTQGTRNKTYYTGTFLRIFFSRYTCRR